MNWIEADWPAPTGVRVLTTTISGGVSQDAWASLNLGDHVGDDPLAVMENRRRLAAAIGLPGHALNWLRQVHGTRVLDLDTAAAGGDREADAALTCQPGRAAIVMTADCLPVALASADGRCMAVAHAGWRGLAAGILANTLCAMQARGVPAGRIQAWLGPAIGPKAFEVGPEVKAAFISADASAVQAFSPSPAGRWYADLYKLARQALQRAGVTKIYGGGWCTFSDPRFFSHRRQAPCGRMATVIWRN